MKKKIEVREAEMRVRLSLSEKKKNHRVSQFPQASVFSATKEVLGLQ